MDIYIFLILNFSFLKVEYNKNNLKRKKRKEKMMFDDVYKYD